MPQILTGQHQALHWHAFQSLIPLNAEEGKEVLQLIRELTTDSISSFADKNDHFSFATKEEENLDNLADQLNAAGFYLVDVSNPRLENQYYVRTTKGFQYAILFCLEPVRFQEIDPPLIKLTLAAHQALSADHRLLVQSNNKFDIQEE
ncbi:MAG: hypothetical protein ACKVOK_12305 [Flavobacteriales bacterium]